MVNKIRWRRRKKKRKIISISSITNEINEIFFYYWWGPFAWPNLIIILVASKVIQNDLKGGWKSINVQLVRLCISDAFSCSFQMRFKMKVKKKKNCHDFDIVNELNNIKKEMKKNEKQLKVTITTSINNYN